MAKNYFSNIFYRKATPAILFFAVCMLIASAASGQKKTGQPPAPTIADTTSDDHINIRWADEFLYTISGLDTLQKLNGNVELNQDTIFLFCDSARILNSTDMVARGNFILQQGDSLTIFADSAEYSSTLKIAELFSNVALMKGRQKLFTERLTYDVNTKIATYFTGATMTDDTTFLTSVRGYFNSETDDIFFKDSVVVVNPDFTLRSDTLKYNARSNIVTFLAPTLITQDTAKIYTEAGIYDIGRKSARFTKNPQYQKHDQKAWAEVMRYDGELEEVILIGNAHFEDSTTVATADRIRHNDRTGITMLEGNAFIRDDQRIVTGEKVTYDSRNETYSTRGRSHIVDGDQVLDANEVDYDKERELGIARGNVLWRDTSENLTVVAEFAEHSKKKNFLKASGGRQGRPLLIREVDGDSLFIAADTLMSLTPEDAAKLAPARPISDNLAIDSTLTQPGSLISAADSLPDSLGMATPGLPGKTTDPGQPEEPEVVTADTVSTVPERPETPPVPEPETLEPLFPKPLFKNKPEVVLNPDDTLSTPLPDLPNVLPDSTEVVISPQTEVSKPKLKEQEEPRIILAFHDVRIFKSDLQATCDSLSYSTLDSIFRLYRKPIIWSDTSQFTADTVLMQLANDKIDRIFMRQNSFIVNSPDEVFFNQIKGKHSTAFFEEGELRRVRVTGNAESVYYALDDEDAYIGVNKTICSEMMILFGNNELEGIKFYTEPTANLFPMKQADHDALKMPGFSWQEEKRPKSVDDLFVKRKPEVVPPPLVPAEGEPAEQTDPEKAKTGEK